MTHNIIKENLVCLMILGNLSKLEQKVFEACYLDMQDVRQIAEHMNLSFQTIGVAIHRIQNKIKMKGVQRECQVSQSTQNFLGLVN